MYLRDYFLSLTHACYYQIELENYFINLMEPERGEILMNFFFDDLRLSFDSYLCLIDVEDVVG